MERKLEEILDQLEGLVDNAGHIPFTGRVLVEADRVYDLLDNLRAALPEGVQQAQRILRERDRIIAQAREEAEAIVKEAQAYAEKLTRESAIAQRAEEEAGRILDEARRQSREIKMGAREYAAELLQRLEGNLQKCLAVVRQGLEELGPVGALSEEERHEARQ